MEKEWTELGGRRNDDGREWLMFLLQKTGWLAMLPSEEKEKQVLDGLEEPRS